MIVASTPIIRKLPEFGPAARCTATDAQAMSRATRIIVRAGIVAAILILAAAFAVVVLIRDAFPRLSGERSIEGLRAAVDISRDGQGVAHIRASSTDDLFFAQGYLHASERLWQMEFQRRVVFGRLAEIFGEDLIEADKFLRRIDLARIAERSVDTAGPDARRMIDRYVEGVNAFLEVGRRPIELKLLGVQPEPWSARDVGALAALIAFDLDRNWSFEAVRQAMIEGVGAGMVEELLPPYDYRGPPIWSAGQAPAGGEAPASAGGAGERGQPIVRERPSAGEHPAGAARAAPPERPAAGARAIAPEHAAATGRAVARDLDINPSTFSEAVAGAGAVRRITRLGPIAQTGSNSWVVSGERTEDGVAHLAVDTHLALSLPSPWYEHELEVPGEYWVRGFGFPGAPMVIIGYNERIAWGATHFSGDTQDLYLERRHPEEPGRFELDGTWYEGEVRTETIEVAGRSQPEEIEVARSRHGPIVVEDSDLALRWTAFEIEESVFDTFLGINTARDWESFREALRSWGAPAHNLVYADVDGDIAFRTAGRVPVRQPGEGLLPQRGWISNEGWQDTIPFEELPELVNPPRGHIGTANYRAAGEDYPYPVAGDPQPPARMRRIVNRLNAEDSMSVEQSKELQTDWYNQHAADRLPRFLEALDPELLDSDHFDPGDPDPDHFDPDLFDPEHLDALRAARATLQEWLEHPVNAPDEPAPLIFSSWHYRAMRGIFEPHMGEELYDDFLEARDFAYNSFEAVLDADVTGWTPDGVDRVLRESFEATIARLVAEHGADVSGWRWDNVHSLELEHPLGEAAALRPLLNRGPYPYGGGQMTVGRASYDLGAPFEVVRGAPTRLIARLGAEIDGWVSHAGGQSGHPGHRWYSDQLGQWLDGGYRRVRHFASDDPPARWSKRLLPREDP